METRAQLRKNLEASVADLQAAETAFYEARAGKDDARRAASATDHIKFKSLHESASDQILERAAAVETGLAAYREVIESDYRNEMQAASVETRRLYEERQALEVARARLEQQIIAATEKEKPAVGRAVANERLASEYAQNWNEFKTRMVRLVHESQARAA